jgi:hypothetical protein
MLNIPTSYLGDPWFKYCPATSYPDWGFSWFSSVLPGECQDSTLNLGHNSLLPNPFQFSIHSSPYHYSARYIILVTAKALWNKWQIHISINSTLILSSNLSVGHLTGLFLQAFQHNSVYNAPSTSSSLICSSYYFKCTKYWTPHYAVFSSILSLHTL